MEDLLEKKKNEYEKHLQSQSRIRGCWIYGDPESLSILKKKWIQYAHGRGYLLLWDSGKWEQRLSKFYLLI